MRKLRTVEPERDAFGQELWACFKGQDICEIIERDDGYFSAHQSPKVYFSEYPDWSIIEQKAMAVVKGRVLDIGCGAGRHALYLQQKGFSVVGVDSSRLAVKVCKLRGLKKARVMSLENLSFKPNTFSTILMLGGNFGLMGNPKKTRRLLKKLRRITTKNAIIIAETRDPYNTDNPLHLKYHRLNKSRGKLSGQTRIRVRFEKTVTKWIEWLIVSKEEMEQLINGTGWKISRFIDSENSGYVAILEKAT
ncbi:MAG: class I SAM-dependent methyltransferase [Candidatus Bathyarchaeia archaeon]